MSAHGPFIRTLDGLALLARAGADAEELLGSGKPAALIAYLEASPHREATREHLVDLLWADMDPTAGRHALRQTIWYVKRKAGDAVLDTRDDVLALARGVSSDRHAFVEAVEHGRYARAVDLYRGEFIPHFGAPGAAAFEHWADRERDHLRMMFSRAGEMVVREALSAGKARDAIALGRRVRDLAPQVEANWRLVLESVAAAGDPVLAAAELARVEQMLAADDRVPDPSTRALIRVLKGAPRHGASDPADEAARRDVAGALVGREAEFAKIVDAYERAARGFVHVHVEGAAGFGKTRLVGDVELRLRAGRARVVAVRAAYGERDIPGAASARLAVALAALPGARGISPGAASTLVALAPSLSSQYSAAPDAATGDDAIRRRFLAIAELASVVSEERPVAIFVDDLHWFDDTSRRVLAGVAGHLQAERVLLVTTSRPPAPMRLGDAVLRLACDPLSESDILQFISSIGHLPDEAWAASLPGAIHAFTGGAALLVVETMALAMEREVLALRDAAWHAPSPGDLASLLQGERAIVQRIRGLDRVAGFALRLLAAAGVAVPVGVLAAATRRGEAEVAVTLGQLEQKGLAVRVGEAWMVVHDEIGWAALAATPGSEMPGVHAALGAGFAANATETGEFPVHAARHLLQGGATGELRDFVRRHVRAARRGGDARTPAEIVGDLLGPDAPAAARDDVVSSLAWYERRPVRWVVRVAAAIVLVVAGGAAAALMLPGADPPDAMLVLNESSGRRIAVRTLELRRNRWGTGTIVAGAGRLRTVGEAVARQSSDNIFMFPDGSVSFSSNVSRPGGVSSEAFVLTSSGVERQLTDSPADDGPPLPSPDARFGVFQTARWDTTTDHGALAIIDMASGAVRRLTHSRAIDAEGHWSPDGSRIAFVRKYTSGRPMDICVIAVDGTDERCTTPSRPGTYVASLLAWDGGATALIQADSGGFERLGAISLASGAVTVLDSTPSTVRTASPDGQWVACLCAAAAGERTAWYVHPTAEPSHKRLIAGTAQGRQPASVEIVAARGAPYVDTLRIASPPDAHVGLDLQLEAEAVDQRGHPIALPYVRWSGLDSTVARVSASGILTGVRPGRVRVVASAGGWRSDTAVVLVSAPRHRIVLQETWNDPETRWIFYGEPRATVVTTSEGRAMWNNGDGRYTSGVVLRQQLSGTTGVGLRAWTQLRLTQLQWQVVAITLQPNEPTRRLRAFNLEMGTFTDNGPRGAFAQVALPAGEGTPGDQRILVSSAKDTRPIEARELLDGRWARLDLQCFPDGRCAVAVEGRVVWYGETPSPAPDSVRVHIQGASVGTMVLVGRFEAWEGIRDDVDWSATPVSVAEAVRLSRSRPRATAPR
ncbi:MAG: AAA family ATPase [Gemmatimonadota bacterium]|nr:AAA family ATPase [Gemmatimonadota bacterium]